MLQWLRICPAMQGTPVQSLVREDPICHPATKPWSQHCGARCLRAVLCNRGGHHDEKPCVTARESPQQPRLLTTKIHKYQEKHFTGASLLYNVALLLLLLLSHFSRVRLCAAPSLGFSRQEHWSGLPFPSPINKDEKWKKSHSVVSDS